MNDLNIIFQPRICTSQNLQSIKQLISSQDPQQIDLSKVENVLTGNDMPKAALLLIILGSLSQKLNDSCWDNNVAQIISVSLDRVELRKAWAFAMDQIGQRNPALIFKWENNISCWIMNDASDCEYLIKLYRHMFNEFHLISDKIFNLIETTRNEKNRICLFHALVMLVKKTRLKKGETVELLVKYLKNCNFEYLIPYLDMLARTYIDGKLLKELAEKLPLEDSKYSTGILDILWKFAQKEENIMSLFSQSGFDFGIFFEKLFSLSLSKSTGSVLASDLLTIFKKHHLLSFYMTNLSHVFNNHPLELLQVIQESCDYICLSALKICSLTLSFWKMTSLVSDETVIISSLIKVLTASPKSRHLLLKSMLKTDYGKRFVHTHLESLTELICTKLDLELCVKVCFFKHALSYKHPAVDSEYIKKAKILFSVTDILPMINLWDMYLIAIVALKSGWWNIATCYLQTLSCQKNLSSKTSEWLLFLKGYAEEEDALVSLKSEEADCESFIETLDFMVESELPSNLPLFHSHLLSTRRFLLVTCKNLLKSYISEVEIEVLIQQMASSIKNLRGMIQTWADIGYPHIRDSVASFIRVLLAGRTLEQFETELDPCPEVISVIETLDFKVIEFIFSFTWNLPDRFFQGL